MGRVRNAMREVEWFAVIAVILLIGAIALAVFTSLATLALVLGLCAVVSAIFSYRT